MRRCVVEVKISDGVAVQGRNRLCWIRQRLRGGMRPVGSENAVLESALRITECLAFFHAHIIAKTAAALPQSAAALKVNTIRIKPLRPRIGGRGAAQRAEFFGIITKQRNNKCANELCGTSNPY